MASPAPLQLFPSVNTTQPRKSSLKKPRPIDANVAPGELKGSAILVKSAPNSPPLVVQPANDHVKHSLFCDPSSPDHNTSNRGGPRRHLRALRRYSGSGVSNSTSPSEGAAKPLPTDDDDQLSPLPENTHFGPGKPQKGHIKRPKLPQNISTEAQPDVETLVSPGGDTVSPLPDKVLFSNASPRHSEFPPSNAMRSESPALFRSNSTATTVPPYSHEYFPPTNSIFPQYDHSKSLHQQAYYPTVRSPTPTLPNEKISKLGSRVEQKKSLKRLDSAVALVDGYEHIPSATDDDMMAIWNASCGIFPVPGRKVQLGLVQPHGKGTTLAVGNSDDELLYSMGKEALPMSSKDSKASRQLVIKKHKPQDEKSTPFPVAQLELPDADRSKKEREDDVVSIFPQMAAIKAIEAVANSPMAASIATFDPRASSPEAARLAQDAVGEARRRHRCELVRNTRKRDSLGAVTALYNLQHPLLGPFAITVTKSTIGRHSRDPRAKISLHHPSATPAAVSAETLVLAFLDFARDACVLDTPGLLALESSYIIDTVICALLAVAVIENDALMAETITFDAPPKAPLPLPKQNSRRSSRRSSSSTESKRSSSWLKRDKKAKVEYEPEQVELPVLTQGALAILGLSFKTAVWVLEAGVKVTAGVLIGITHLAKKA